MWLKDRPENFLLPRKQTASLATSRLDAFFLLNLMRRVAKLSGFYSFSLLGFLGDGVLFI